MSETTEVKNYLDSLSATEKAEVTKAMDIMRADRAVIVEASKNLRFQTVWSRQPPTGYQEPISNWYNELVKLTTQVVDIHFRKEDQDKHHAFILVSPDVRCILEHASGLNRLKSVPNTLPIHATLTMEWYLKGVPVYQDCYLPYNVLYVGSGNLDTPGFLRVDSMSAIKINKMYS